MTLTEFLRARITERYAEDVALRGALLMIVELHEGHHECVGDQAAGRRTVLVAPGYQFENDPTLALLALAYMDHPDYDESWSPLTPSR